MTAAAKRRSHFSSCWPVRTLTNTVTGKPTFCRLTIATRFSIYPSSSRRLTRFQQGVLDKPIFSLRAAIDRVPSLCSAARMAQSNLSSETFGEFISIYPGFMACICYILLLLQCCLAYLYGGQALN